MIDFRSKGLDAWVNGNILTISGDADDCLKTSWQIHYREWTTIKARPDLVIRARIVESDKAEIDIDGVIHQITN